MLARLSDTLKKYAKNWLILVFFVPEVLFYTVIMPGLKARLEAVSGGTGPIDLQFFYTPERVYSMIASYGGAGRAMYRMFELTGDIIYPIIYTIFFSLLITWLFQRGFAANSKMQRLNIIPFVVWLFDLLENMTIAAMLSLYPATITIFAWLATIFTMIKWSLAVVSTVLVLIGLVMALKNGFKKQ